MSLLDVVHLQQSVYPSRWSVFLAYQSATVEQWDAIFSCWEGSLRLVSSLSHSYLLFRKRYIYIHVLCHNPDICKGGIFLPNLRYSCLMKTSLNSLDCIQLNTSKYTVRFARVLLQLAVRVAQVCGGRGRRWCRRSSRRRRGCFASLSVSRGGHGISAAV